MNNCKRILYVGGFQLPDKNAAAHRVIGIAKILNKIGYEVIFLDVDDDRNAYMLSEKHTEAGYAVYSQKRPGGIKRWASYVLNPLHVEEVLDKYDNWAGVIAYNYPAIALYKLKKICNARNIKIYSDCTEWYQSGISFSVRDIALKFDSLFRMRFVQKKLDGIIVISSYLEDYYSKHILTVKIPPLVDKNDEKWHKPYDNNGSDQIKLVYAGSPGKTKDKLDIIVRTLSKFDGKKIMLDVVGITEKEYLDYYPEDEVLVAASTNIKFLGRLSHLDALELVKASNYTIFYREITKVSMAGFPTKFVESISCGVPVITNSTSDLNKYLIGNKNGFILSTENFEKELEVLLGSIVSGREGITNVEENVFDYRNYEKQLSDWIYKSNI